MGEFASKGVAGTGLGLGIAGTALGVPAGGANGDGSGILGGIFGNNGGNKMAALLAENGMLKSENYADSVGKNVYTQSLADNRGLRDELFAFIKPLAEESANNRQAVAVLQANQAKNAEIADLREKLVRSELTTKIDNVANTCGCGIAQLNNAVAALSGTVNNITRTVIPAAAICPEVMLRYNSWTTPTDSSSSS